MNTGMTDRELIEWVKQLTPGITVPNEEPDLVTLRLIRIVQLLVDNMEEPGVVKRKPGRPRNTLKLNKTA